MEIIIFKNRPVAGIPVYPGIDDLDPEGIGLVNDFLQERTGIGKENFFHQRIRPELAFYPAGYAHHSGQQEKKNSHADENTNLQGSPNTAVLKIPPIIAQLLSKNIIRTSPGGRGLSNI